MKRKQKAYKQRLKPKYEQPTKATWEGWCLFAAMRSCDPKEITIDQEWKAKCHNMASANRYRLPRLKAKRLPRKEITWAQFVKKASKKPKKLTKEQEWKRKLKNKASNQKRRMQMKAEMRRLQADRCTK